MEIRDFQDTGNVSVSAWDFPFVSSLLQSQKLDPWAGNLLFYKADFWILLTYFCRLRKLFVILKIVPFPYFAYQKKR
jgi:hypothetical protein